jgi:hypothetical protein
MRPMSNSSNMDQSLQKPMGKASLPRPHRRCMRFAICAEFPRLDLPVKEIASSD